jgi:hypothetical protein
MKKTSITKDVVAFASKAIIMAFTAFFCVSLTCKGGITTYPIPKGEAVFDGYQLQVDGQPVAVYSCRVSAVPFDQWWPGYQRPVDQTELAGFAYWDMRGSVKVQITTKQSIDGIVVRPLSLGIKPKVEGNIISFELNSISPVVVEVNGYHNTLHLFPNPEQKDIPKAKSPICSYQCNNCSPMQDSISKSGLSHFHYFAPGVHDVGTLQLQSNDSVYIAGGAVVYGCLIADNANNIRVWGRGVIDGSRIERADRISRGGFGCIHFRNSSNINVDGIVLRDPDSWGFTLRGCSGVNILDLKLVGFWRYNADGIDVWNSRDVLIENCFVRSYDDALVVRGTGSNSINNIHFNKCVLWCDWGIGLEIYNIQNSSTTIKNVTFENISIIHATHKAINIIHGNLAISNITYDNVNVELDEWNLRPKMQESKDEKYTFDPKDKYCPSLITINIPKHKQSTGGTFSSIDGILFKDIKVYGNTNTLSSISVYDAENGAVTNVVIKNLQFNGKIVEDIKQANLSISPYVSGVQMVK